MVAHVMRAHETNQGFNESLKFQIVDHLRVSCSVPLCTDFQGTLSAQIEKMQLDYWSSIALHVRPIPYDIWFVERCS